MSSVAAPSAPWLPEGSTLVDHAGPTQQPLSLYIHVPFCSVRCGYCDFNTYTTGFGSGAEPHSYHQGVIRELRYAAAVLDSVQPRPVETVFIGGGTPTLLPDTGLAQIMGTLRERFELCEDAEVTIEANPDTVDAKRLQTLRGLGINRVSVGMQSAVGSVLRMLDRTHNPSHIPEVIRGAKAAGLRTSLDLIYGTPGETIADWQRSLEAAIATGTEHISTYALVIEPGTAMGAKLRRGLIPAVDSDDQAGKYELADRLLSAAGYQWYELSNWAKTPTNPVSSAPPRSASAQASAADYARTRAVPHASRHNLAYWHDHDWWGIGPGAHSHWGMVRWWNRKHPRAWFEAVAAGQWPQAGGEVLTAEERELEYLMLSIRTLDGTRISRIHPSRRQRIGALIADGLVEERDGTHLCLTLRGRLMADLVTRELSC